MKTNLIILIVSLTVIYAVNAIPQRNLRPRQSNPTDDVQMQIDSIFPPQTTEQSFRGAGAIITPGECF